VLSFFYSVISQLIDKLVVYKSETLDDSLRFILKILHKSLKMITVFKTILNLSINCVNFPSFH